MNERIPQDWSEAILSDMVEVDSSSLNNATQPDYEFHYIDIASVSTGRVTVPAAKIKFSESPSRARRIIKTGDVLMSTVRPNLKAFAYFDSEAGDCICSTGFSVLRAKEANVGRFIFNSILSDGVSKQIDALVAGSNYPAINSGDVKNLRIPNPPKKEQQKIASILTSVDEVMEKTKAQISKLQDLKKGMMQELLTNGIGHTEFKDSPVGRIPKGWEVSRLEEITVRIRDGNYGADYPKSSEMLSMGVPFLTSTVIGNDQKINMNKLKFISSEKHEQLAKAHIKYNDILFTNRGANVGNVAIVPESLNDANIGPQLTLLRVESSSCINTFLYISLQSDVFKEQLKKLDSGSAMNFFGIGTTEQFKFAVPPINEQVKISNAVTSVSNKIDFLTSNLIQQQNLKKALMQDLLTGKVRVKTD